MSTFQITNTRPDGTDADRRIDGFRIAGEYFTIEQVIDWVRTGAHRFYVSVFGRSVWVILKYHHTTGRPYLTTEGDSFPPNNLLSLPSC